MLLFPFKLLIFGYTCRLRQIQTQWNKMEDYIKDIKAWISRNFLLFQIKVLLLSPKSSQNNAADFIFGFSSNPMRCWEIYAFITIGYNVFCLCICCSAAFRSSWNSCRVTAGFSLTFPIISLKAHREILCGAIFRRQLGYVHTEAKSGPNLIF